MLIIIDEKMPIEAKENLKKFGDILELETEGITNDYLSGHPDIFFFQNKEKLIVAPNLPQKYIKILESHDVDSSRGEKPVESDYPRCALYNATLMGNKLIHKKGITDKSIFEEFSLKNLVDVNQGLTRCSFIPICEDAGITSDEGIYKTLIQRNFNVLLVKSKDINLPGMEYGLFGGCCGYWNNTLYIIGSLKYFNAGEKVHDFCQINNVKIHELYDGTLFDGGGILFIE